MMIEKVFFRGAKFHLVVIFIAIFVSSCARHTAWVTAGVDPEHTPYASDRSDLCCCPR